jgi:hypothetical protein
MQHVIAFKYSDRPLLSHCHANGRIPRSKFKSRQSLSLSLARQVSSNEAVENMFDNFPFF